MNTNIILYFILFVTLTSCSRYPSDVTYALQLSEDNRNELEKVLEHYRQNKNDILKYKAACFLIANMPYHYSLHHTKLDSFKHIICSRETDEMTYLWFTRKYGSFPHREQYEVIYDVHRVTSEFLMKNIEFSFNLWKEVPWGKYISFDQFCEELLPYRLNDEPLEDWKETYYRVFQPLMDSLPQDDPVAACKMVINRLKKEEWEYERRMNTPSLGGLTLLKSRYGNCKEQTEFLTYAMRALGIPSGIDLDIQNPDNSNSTHYWSYVRDCTGKTIGFEFDVSDSSELRMPSTRKYGKAYRFCYALQEESIAAKYNDRYIPPNLRNFLFRDVSTGYFPGGNINFTLEAPMDVEKLLYLCVFNNSNWIPIAWSGIRKKKIAFKGIESGVLYQLYSISERGQVPLSEPFVFKKDGSLSYFKPDTGNTQSMTLIRKYKLSDVWPERLARAINGKFQAANKANFSDAVTLYTIEDTANMLFNTIQLSHQGKYKYVGYLSADSGFNNMAEVQFFFKNKQLKGKVIGTDGSIKNDRKRTKRAVFDGDPLSFFDSAEPSGSRAGLEFDKAYRINTLKYIFRNDDNNIKVGDQYELRYWFDGKWVSAGYKIADSTVLHFDKVPSNALYWLRNHSRGNEERPFSYNNDKQLFW